VSLQERLADNHIEVANSNAGTAPKISAKGTDTNINLDLAGKGTGSVRANGNPVLTAVAVPAKSDSPGTPGQIAFDTGFLYVCVAANTWRRQTLLAW
jgi:hypothetical protein